MAINMDFLLIHFFLSHTIAQTSPNINSNTSIRIVGASCNYQHAKYQPSWQYMHESNPYSIILLGDNVYLDLGTSESCLDNQDISSYEDNGEGVQENSLSCFNWPTNHVKQSWYKNPIVQYDTLLNHTDFVFYGNNKTYNYPQFRFF